MLHQRAKHLIWTAAKKDLVFLAYLVAVPLQRLRCRKAFSTKGLSLYKSLSYSLGTFRFFLGGITAIMGVLRDGEILV
jgi:hypothetical protein